MKLPLQYNFTYDSDKLEWYREDFNLSLIMIHKMDMYKPIWSLSKFNDSNEEGECLLFRAEKDEMSEFIKKYIRANKLNVILDENN